MFLEGLCPPPNFVVFYVKSHYEREGKRLHSTFLLTKIIIYEERYYDRYSVNFTFYEHIVQDVWLVYKPQTI